MYYVKEYRHGKYVRYVLRRCSANEMNQWKKWLGDFEIEISNRKINTANKMEVVVAADLRQREGGGRFGNVAALSSD